MPTKADYAKLAIARKALSLSEEQYRDIMAMNCNGKTSAKALNAMELATLFGIFADRGWRPTSPKTVKSGHKATRRVDDNYRRIPPGPAAKQQRYVVALWVKLGYEVKKLDIRVKKQFGLDRFEWLTDHDSLRILITDLRQRCLDAGLDPDGSTPLTNRQKR
jgi:hypothetical protein